MSKETKNKMSLDVLCVGHACLDWIFEVEKHPDEDEKMLADQLTICGGGPAANAAVAVARLGYQSAFLGYLGNDIHGDHHIGELLEDGVLTDWIIRGEHPTPLVSLMVKPDGKRSAVNFKGATQPTQSHTLNLDEVHPEVVLFDGHEPDISPGICDEAKSKGIPTVLDAGSLHKGTELLMSEVDCLVASEPFTKKLTEADEPDQAIHKLGYLASTAVMTLGDQGLIWKKDGIVGRMGAFQVNAVDTTGAGDAFHGAFAAGLSQKMNWDKLLVYASAVGALTCTQVGARLALPGETELNEFLLSHTIRGLE